MHSMAMGGSKDLELLQETLDFISKKARDQDMFYYFNAISNNFKGRRLLTKYFQDNYDIVSNDRVRIGWYQLIGRHIVA